MLSQDPEWAWVNAGTRLSRLRSVVRIPHVANTEVASSLAWGM